MTLTSDITTLNFLIIYMFLWKRDFQVHISDDELI